MNGNFWTGMLVNAVLIIGGLFAVLLYADHHQAYTFVELTNAMDTDFENFVKQPLLAFTVLLLMQPLLIFTAKRLSRMKFLQQDVTKRDQTGE